MRMTTTREDHYRQTVSELSARIVEAQRPIRILDAIKWDASVQEAFLAGGCRDLPAVDRGYYDARPLPYDPEDKRKEFEGIVRDIRRTLGRFNPLGQIMERLCGEYADAVRLLANRGSRDFCTLSQHLYGSAHDAFHAGDPTLADMARMLSEVLSNLPEDARDESREKVISGEDAVGLLQQRLSAYFHDADRPIYVKLSDGIVSDAAAGADYIKIRKDARFSEREIRALEVHEGWVHLGTTLNGLAQPWCSFLSKAPPSATITQEGLAVIMEIFTFSSHPARVKRLTDRVHAIHMAEEGANFLEVFRYFREQGYGEADGYTLSSRIFRGSTPEGGPFTKDLSYSKGFILIYNYTRLAVRRGLIGRIPLLFCGKSTLEDIRTLSDLVDEGVVDPPKHLPAPFNDLSALSAWMCYSSFIDRLDLWRIESDYAAIL